MKPLNIVHLFPELLNLYGDGGNVMTLRRRCEWRNIPVQVTEVGMGDSIDFSSADIVFIGGGADREQLIVKDAMMSRKADLSSYVADAGVLLAVCGGYQFLGHHYAMDDVVVDGLGIVDMETVRGEGRLIGNAIVKSDISDIPVGRCSFRAGARADARQQWRRRRGGRSSGQLDRDISPWSAFAQKPPGRRPPDFSRPRTSRRFCGACAA